MAIPKLQVESKRSEDKLQKALKNADDWDYSIFHLEEITHKRPLVHLSMKLFERWNVREFLGCSDVCLRRWLEVQESNYHADNPYHNAVHAADVLHATACFLQNDVVAKTLERSDQVAALLAAVVHDVGHLGRGSSFLVNTRHPLAKLYNDKSVLENYHASLAFCITHKNARIDIFSKLSREKYDSLRKCMIDMIIATDMSRHKKNMTKFQATMAQYPLPLKTNDKMSDEDKKAVEETNMSRRKTILRMLIKCADVSNPCRPWDTCREWALRIVEEYFRQTEEEKAKQLPLTLPWFDREACNIPLTQTTFINMFVRDMFKAWTDFTENQELLPILDDNYKIWNDKKDTWLDERDDFKKEMLKYEKQRKRVEEPHHYLLKSLDEGTDS